MDQIFIAGNVPSSKNSKVWTGKYLVHSKTVRNYISKTKQDWLSNKEKFLEDALEYLKNDNLDYKIIVEG